MREEDRRRDIWLCHRTAKSRETDEHKHLTPIASRLLPPCPLVAELY